MLLGWWYPQVLSDHNDTYIDLCVKLGMCAIRGRKLKLEKLNSKIWNNTLKMLFFQIVISRVIFILIGQLKQLKAMNLIIHEMLKVIWPNRYKNKEPYNLTETSYLGNCLLSRVTLTDLLLLSNRTE